MKRGIITALLLIAIVFLGILVMMGVNRDRIEKPQVKQDTIEAVNKIAEVVEPKPKKEETQKVAEKETFSQKQAVRKAESYLDIFGYSSKGLINQLKFEGFTTEEATYAVNKVGF